MKLAAIYIPDGVLMHIFGKDHKGQTINLGGRYIYTFEQDSENQIILKGKNENTKFIENFWLNNIQLISAIVGANGTGKTSLLKFLVEEISSNPKQRNCILVYEDIDNIKIKNETTLKFSSEFEIKLIDKRNELNEKILYYSPNLDYDIIAIDSPISLVNYHEKSLENYYLNNVRRHLFFLKNREIISELKNSYKDFPFYNKIIFKAKSLYKSDFEKVYIQSTLGNKFFKVRNQLLDLLRDKETIELNEEDVEYFFNKSETIQDELKLMWDSYPNSTENKQQYVNSGNNFIKDIEINILSYLVLEDAFALDGDYGEYPLSNILKTEKFDEKLTHFLRKFIIQTSKIIYNSLCQNSISIDTSNFEKLKIEVQKQSNPNLKFRGVDFETKSKNVLKQIELIESVYNFYTMLISFQNENYCETFVGGFLTTIENSDIEKFNDLIDSYEKMLSNLEWSDIGGVLEITSEKKLSTGEKSLLDFYASLYNYLRRWKGSHMYSKNCILLLDEPEQGYHPFWKKKFIKALTATLPNLFGINKTIENIQIIITTHDPLTLSDIPNNNIVYLYKTTDGKTELLEQISKQRPTKTFGANISDLIADSFFVTDGLIGDFAKEKIENIIIKLNQLVENKNTNRVLDIPEEERDKIYKTISIIDEPIIKNKLIEMYNSIFDIAIENEIQELEERIKYLKNLKDSQND